MSIMGHCCICTGETEAVRHIDIYVTGSEGLYMCLECELLIVGYIRDLRNIVAKAKMLGVKIGRRE